MAAGLICFLGYSPGVVTTAYHALNDHFVDGERLGPIDRVVSISTALPGFDNRTERTYEFVKRYFRAIGKDEDFYTNWPLSSDDIWSVEDTDECWETLRLVILELRESLYPDCNIHMSLSGGRRAMSAVAMLACSWESVDGLVAINVSRDLETGGSIQNLEELDRKNSAKRGILSDEIARYLNPPVHEVSVIRLPFQGLAANKEGVAAFYLDGVQSGVPETMYHEWVRGGLVDHQGNPTKLGERLFERIGVHEVQIPSPLADYGIDRQGDVEDRERLCSALRGEIGTRTGQEDLYLEFKAMRLGPGLTREALETLCAFANSEGGLLLLGVADTTEGLAEQHAESIRLDIEKRLGNYENSILSRAIHPQETDPVRLDPPLRTGDLTREVFKPSELGLNAGKILAFIVRPRVRFGRSGKFELCRVVTQRRGTHAKVRTPYGNRRLDPGEIAEYRRTGLRSWL